MGIYDRDYYRDDEPQRPRRRSSTGLLSWSAVAIIILINVLLFFANGLLFPNDSRLTDFLMMKAHTLSHPLQWYKLFTYGFAHSPQGIQHILFNMIALFFFGRPIEQHYGKKEFLLLYFFAILTGGIVWGIANFNAPNNVGMLGASGAIATVVILFSLNYPHAQVLLFALIPMPAWLLGIFFVVSDTMGAFGSPVTGQTNVAYQVHLAGAGVAILYFFFKVRLSSIFRLPTFSPHEKKPDIRVWQQDNSPKDNSIIPNSLEQEVDYLLRKISQQGESSLTYAEREKLREASRIYQEKMKK